jgi:NADPH2:quinone reductase
VIAAVAGGRLRPYVGRRFPLEDAAAAHTAITGRATTGKTVLEP